MRMVNGCFPLSEKPGLGFDLDEKAPYGWLSSGMVTIA